MAQTQTSVQEDLDSCMDDIAEAKELLLEAYAPEADRETLATAIGQALDVLEDYESSDESSQDWDDNDDPD